MKKILPLLVAGFFILNGLGAVALTNTASNNMNTCQNPMKAAVEFSPVIIEEYSTNYADVRLEDSESYVMEPGRPVLPKFVHVVELDFGVQNVERQLHKQIWRT